MQPRSPVAFDLDWIALRTGDRERRQIVVVAVRFAPALEGDPAGSWNAIGTQSAIVSDIADRHRGVVLPAYPGLHLICWGWHAADEAECRLAVAAALEIAGDMRWRVRCGVDAGIAAVPPFDGGAPHGSDVLSADDTVRGAVTHSAAAGFGQVVISDVMRHLIEGMFELRPLETGLGERTGLDSPAWIVERAATSAVVCDGACGLVGRAGTLAQFEEIWGEVLRGGGGAILLQGEAGVGKSAFVRHLRGLVVDTGGRMIVVACQPERQSHRGWAADALATGFAAGLATGLDVAPGDAGGVSSTPASLDALLRQCRRAGPLTVVVEDIQWADPDSCEVFARLAGTAASHGVLFVLTTRASLRDAADRIIGGVDRVVSLGRLPVQDIDEVICASTYARHLTGPARKLICERADGIVAHALELARLVAGIPNSDAHHRLLSRPNRINSALTARLDRLSSLKPLVQVAAVLGRVFDSRVLAAVLAIDERVLGQRLALLVRFGLLSRSSARPATSYRFREGMLWTQAYGSIVKGKRQDLHLLMARELERRHSTDSDIRPEIVAYHWKQGGMPAEAFGWWSIAAYASAARGEEAGAIGFIDEAMAALQNAPDACTPLEAAGLQSLLASQQQALRGSVPRDAIGAYRSALDFLASGEAPPTDLDLDIAWGISSIHLVRGDVNVALTESASLLEEARERGRLDLQVLALRTLGTANLMGGRVREAVELLTRSADLMASGIEWQSSHSLISDPAASVLAHLSRALALAGDAAGARQRRREALEQTGRVKDAHTSSNILGVLALGAIHLGETGVAAALSRASEAVASQHGHTYWAVRGALVYRWGRAMRDPANEFEGLMHALDAYVAQGAGRAVVIAHCLVGEVAIEARRPEEALALVRPMKNRGRLQGEWIYIPEVLRIEALALDRLGGSAVAIDQILGEAERLARSLGCAVFVDKVLATRAQIRGGSTRGRTSRRVSRLVPSES